MAKSKIISEIETKGIGHGTAQVPKGSGWH